MVVMVMAMFCVYFVTLVVLLFMMSAFTLTVPHGSECVICVSSKAWGERT